METLHVLIADDDPTTCCILEGLLDEQGYHYESVPDGTTAWEKLTTAPFDIAILDWMMPGYDGPTLCQMLKEHQTATNTYTILLSAKTTSDEVVQGLEAGADDFITKPFNSNELLSRIAVGKRIITYEHKIQRQSTDLKHYAHQMEELAEQRAKQLVDAEKMVTLGVLSASIAHEINNPATFISGNVSLMDKFWNVLSPCIEHRFKGADIDDDKVNFILEEMPKMLKGMHEGIQRITNIVNGLRGYARRGTQQHERKPCQITDSIENALQICQKLKHYHISIEKDIPPDLPMVFADNEQIEQVFVNLFVNAADAMENLSDGRLVIQAETIEGRIQISIDDNGPGLSQEAIMHLWELFFTTKERGRGTGLGLSISQQIIEEHDGFISAENLPERGTRFMVILPHMANKQHGNGDRLNNEGTHSYC